MIESDQSTLFRDRLEETSEFIPGTDAQVIRDTFRVYGSAFSVMLFVFCVVRKCAPRLYNVRRWSPRIQCELAQHNYGFLSWIWKVYGPTDEEILDQCGMDSLCFLRIMRFGLQISFVGILNSFWLLPMYATADTSSETDDVKDPVEEMTTSNLPSMSPRFIGTVVGSYIVFLCTMYLLIREFDWYTKHRHSFLSKRTPRNYAIYVTGIPKEYRSSQLLLEYFRSCFPPRSVLEAHVAIDIPNLTNLVSTRDSVLSNLEHALAVKRIYGYSPTHLTLQGKVGSISTYRKELRHLNSSIRNALRRIKMKSAESYADMKLMVAQDIDATYFNGSCLDPSEHNHSQHECEETHPLHPESYQRPSESNLYYSDALPASSESKNLDPYAKLRSKKRKFRDRLSIFTMPEDVEFRDFIALHPDEEIGFDGDKDTRNVPISSICIHEEWNDFSHSSNGEEHTSITELAPTKSCPEESTSDHASRQLSIPEELTCDPASRQSSIPEDLTGYHASVQSSSIQDCEPRQDIATELLEQPRVCDNDVKGEIDCSAKRTFQFPCDSGDEDLAAFESIVPQRADFRHLESLETVTLDSSRVIVASGNPREILQGVVKPGKIIKVLTGSSTETIAREVGNVIKEVSVENLKSATDKGIRTLKKTGIKGIKQVSSVGTSALSEVVLTAKDLILRNEDGYPRDAGFVVFTQLSTTHAALQMIHHSKPYVMDVKEAPEPHDIFWDNVGKSQQSRQVGQLLSFALSAVLCFFWTIPVSAISGLSEIESLKQSVPFLATLVEEYPWLQNALALIAPMLLIGLNLLLPSILREFAKAEGHVASSTLEASVFVKLSLFMIIQTFFVSAISGSVYAQLTQILKNPSAIIDLLANSLPSRGTYFVQIVLVTTFIGQGLELLRVYPLVVAFLRGKIGPNLTEKERNKTFRTFFRPLSDPREFEHAQVFANVVLYFMVIFVYAVISPLINYIMALCFLVMGSTYRYQFISNYPSTPDSGGKLWYEFITICLSCMLIAEITLLGLLALKKATYALPCMAPLMAITVYFTHYLRGKHSYVTRHLPTRDCLRLDRQYMVDGNNDFHFVKDKYLQVALLARDEKPDE